jgi:hypothetical protein
MRAHRWRSSVHRVDIEFPENARSAARRRGMRMGWTAVRGQLGVREQAPLHSRRVAWGHQICMVAASPRRRLDDIRDLPCPQSSSFVIDKKAHSLTDAERLYRQDRRSSWGGHRVCPFVDVGWPQTKTRRCDQTITYLFPRSKCVLIH